MKVIRHEPRAGRGPARDIAPLSAVVHSTISVLAAIAAAHHEEANRRVCRLRRTFTGLIDRSLNEIRQSASGTPAILIHLLDAIADLACFARTREQRDALARHAAMIASAGDRTIKEEQDLMAISKRYDAVVRDLRPESVVIRARKGSPPV